MFSKLVRGVGAVVSCCLVFLLLPDSEEFNDFVCVSLRAFAAAGRESKLPLRATVGLLAVSCAGGAL